MIINNHITTKFGPIHIDNKFFTDDEYQKQYILDCMKKEIIDVRAASNTLMQQVKDILVQNDLWYTKNNSYMFMQWEYLAIRSKEPYVFMLNTGNDLTPTITAHKFVVKYNELMFKEEKMEPGMKVKCRTEDGIEFEIELTPEQERQLCKSQKNEFIIDYDSDCRLATNYRIEKLHGTCGRDITNGSYRKTTELINRKLQTDKEKNRLEEMVHWLDPVWIADWKNTSQQKSYIYYDHQDEIFRWNSATWAKTPGIVYMSVKIAPKLCNELNNPSCEQTRELAQILKGEM